MDISCFVLFQIMGSWGHPQEGVARYGWPLWSLRSDWKRRLHAGKCRCGTGDANQLIRKWTKMKIAISSSFVETQALLPPEVTALQEHSLLSPGGCWLVPGTAVTAAVSWTEFELWSKFGQGSIPSRVCIWTCGDLSWVTKHTLSQDETGPSLGLRSLEVVQAMTIEVSAWQEASLRGLLVGLEHPEFC